MAESQPSYYSLSPGADAAASSRAIGEFNADLRRDAPDRADRMLIFDQARPAEPQLEHFATRITGPSASEEDHRAVLNQLVAKHNEYQERSSNPAAPVAATSYGIDGDDKEYRFVMTPPPGRMSAHDLKGALAHEETHLDDGFGDARNDARKERSADLTSYSYKLMLDPSARSENDIHLERSTVVAHMQTPNPAAAATYYNYAVPSEALDETLARTHAYLDAGGKPSVIEAQRIAEAANEKYLPSNAKVMADRAELGAISAELAQTGTTDLAKHGDVGKTIATANADYVQQRQQHDVYASMVADAGPLVAPMPTGEHSATAAPTGNQVATAASEQALQVAAR